jgi:hypothetical protein
MMNFISLIFSLFIHEYFFVFLHLVYEHNPTVYIEYINSRLDEKVFKISVHGHIKNKYLNFSLLGVATRCKKTFFTGFT